MLDIQFIRDNAETVQRKAKEKGYDISITELLDAYSQRNNLLRQVEDLHRQSNELAEKIKGTKPTEEQIESGRSLRSRLREFDTELHQAEAEFSKRMRAVPNVTFDDVPVGGEEDSVEIKVVGDKPTGAKDHLDYATERGWVDFERGTKVAGNKFYFLKGDLALLENAVIQYALDFIVKKGFTYMTVPHMVNGRVGTGTGFAPRSSDQSDEYFIEGEDLSLIATAEMPLTGYHADEILNEEELPLLYVGLSPCYRKEAGTYGKHTRGLFRVHQFNKLEMYVYTLPEQSREMHENILAIEEELWQAIGIPYHVINIASGDLGAPAAKKYDIEYWSPVDEKYRELTSCSNCTDFQARNLNIRVRRKDGKVQIVHTLNGTAVSMARTLVVLIENFQREDGKLTIPEVLRPYMGGREVI